MFSLKEWQNDAWIASRYDEVGNRLQMTSSFGAAIDVARNPLGNATQLTAGQKEQNPWTARMQYNELGQEIERMLPGDVISQWQYDRTGRPTNHRVSSQSRFTRRRAYQWGANHRLKGIVNELTGVRTTFGYDEFSNLVWSNEGGPFDFLHRSVDDVGNLYETKDKKDRIYGAGSRLLETTDATFSYDEEGNLVQRVEKNSGATWQYEYTGNGMLAKVIKPDQTAVTFNYDALGRRVEKQSNEKTTMFIWDGNTIFHEYFSVDDSEKSENVAENSTQSTQERLTNLITWVFNDGFVPSAKLTSEGNYSIISDYLGTPVEAYDEQGQKVWSAALDIYGRVDEFTGEQDFIPFRYQGQYEDVEIGLYYNRFRYYSPVEGVYTQQDPTRLSGGFTLYNYVADTNNLTDILGLKSNSALLGSNLGRAPGPNHAAHHIVMTGTQDPRMNSLVAQMIAHGIDPDGEENGIWLPRRDTDKVVGGADTSHQQDGLHGNDYKNELVNRLDGKEKEEFSNELQGIKKELNKGRTWETITTKKLGKCTR